VTPISIRGGGIAACCCARLLKRAGLAVTLDSASHARVPAVMLGEVTQKLLGDVFERGDLFTRLHRIRRRAVLWGNSEPTVLPHSAVVTSEQEVLNRLQVEMPPGREEEGEPPRWTILAARVPRGDGDVLRVEQNFGSRTASVTRVKLKTEEASDTCWIEAASEGWLFLLPCGLGTAWLLAAGGPAEALLERSHFVAMQIGETGASAGSFPSHPRITEPLAEPGWLACGSAALAFDPLCGEGAGNAAREAILAAALIRAAASGVNPNELTAHYTARLTAGFARHLEVCRQFYDGGGSGVWWRQQVEDLDRGLQWTAERLNTHKGFQYRLNGFTLEAAI
jgi:flavin-dependent dehydrogenase